MHIIKAGNFYLHRVAKHTYDLVSNKQKAIKYAEESHCYNVIPTLPNTLLKQGQKWEIFDADLDIPVLKKAPQKSTPATPVQQISTDPEYKPDLAEIINKLIVLSKSNYGTRLFSELSRTEQELCDIYHFIENHDLNAADGFKIYKRLQQILRRRREYKDDLKLLNALKDNCNFTELSAVKKEVDNKHYNPRQLAALFEL